MQKTVTYLFICCLLLVSAGCQRSQPPSPAASAVNPAQYQAVLLTNGSVYFGRLEGLGSPNPVLHDVFYVQSNVNPETKAVTNVLVKRVRSGTDRTA